MSDRNKDSGIGMLIGLWILICLITGHSLTSLIFFLVGIFFIAPFVWKNFISKGFEGSASKILMFIALLCLIFAIFSSL